MRAGADPFGVRGLDLALLSDDRPASGTTGEVIRRRQSGVEPPHSIAACVAAVLLVLLLGGCGRLPGDERVVTLAAIGDVFFDRGVAKQIEKHGPDWPFAGTDSIIRAADIAFCNLECPLSKRGVAQRRKYLFRCDPQFAAKLREHGYDAVSLGNNHTLDYGRVGLTDTIAAVRRAGLVSFGAGGNRLNARWVRVIRRNGLRVGFVGYSDITPHGVVRIDSKPDIARLDSGSLAREIEAAKARCDVLVVSIHWGVEYMKRPTERQRKLARVCIDAGADLVLGHHPHVLQPVETYKGKPIAYSLGAFIWDSRIFRSDRSVVLLFELGKSSTRLVKSIPVTITGCRPMP